MLVCLPVGIVMIDRKRHVVVGGSSVWACCWVATIDYLSSRMQVRFGGPGFNMFLWERGT